jgi:hypothetical protein
MCAWTTQGGCEGQVHKFRGAALRIALTMHPHRQFTTATGVTAPLHTMQEVIVFIGRVNLHALFV